MIMMLHKNKIFPFLFTILIGWAWINNNPFWDIYFKIKGIKIQQTFQISENLQLKIETKPYYLNNPLSISPETILNPDSYSINGSLIYHF